MARFGCSTILAFLCAVPSLQGEEAVVPNPDQHCRQALAHLLGMPEQDRQSVRYISLWDVPEKDLWDHRRYFSWLCHQLTFERAVSLPREVDGTGGRLVWIDLRWYGWSPRAWEAVASRDPFTREPWVTFEAAEPLRCAVGYEGVQPGKDGTRPVLALVNGWWLMRDLMETRRSPAYYDLLFSQFRFPEVKEEWRTESYKFNQVRQGDWVYPDDSGRIHKDLPPGYYQVELRFKVKGKGAAFVDFPKNVEEWDKAFGIDILKDFGKERKRGQDWGAIVAGGRDDPVNGSMVALQNRLIVNRVGHDGRLAMRTYDAKETTGKKNFSETLFFRDGKFAKGDSADAVADGGELLYYLPNGGQAGFLIDEKGNRVEVAVGDVANDRADARLNQGVRTVGSCVTCHGGGNGYIVPRDLEAIRQKAGVERKFKDPDQAQRYREFFADYSEEMEGYTKPYARLLRLTTLHPREDELPPWTGDEIAKMTDKIRSDFDAPVDAARGARTLGTPLETFKGLCVRSPNTMPQDLVVGLKIPSRTFEVDVCREIGLLLDAHRGKP